MSEYVKKQALLEYLIPRTMRPIMSNIGNSPFYDGMVEATEIIIQEVKSGAFDAEPVQEVQRLREQRDKLIEALRWYADEENQKLDESTRYWENVYSPYEMDGGQRARDILKEIGVMVE